MSDIAPVVLEQNKQTQAEIDPYWERRMERMRLNIERIRRERLEALAEIGEAHGECAEHHVLLCRDDQQSLCDRKLVSYCPTCRYEAGRADHLGQMGVPTTLARASFSNFIATTDEQRNVLERVERFADEQSGMLLLTGTFGIGKTHLAVAALWRMAEKRLLSGFQPNKTGLFATQLGLLSAKRDTYGVVGRVRDKPEDPVDVAVKIPFLVFDELTPGDSGKDELPMIREILTARYDSYRPTIITSNLSWDKICAIEPRLADRLSECAILIEMTGESYRRQNRDQYRKRAAAINSHRQAIATREC